jgi:hypothetical protein
MSYSRGTSIYHMRQMLSPPLYPEARDPREIERWAQWSRSAGLNNPTRVHLHRHQQTAAAAAASVQCSDGNTTMTPGPQIRGVSTFYHPAPPHPLCPCRYLARSTGVMTLAAGPPDLPPPLISAILC